MMVAVCGRTGVAAEVRQGGGYLERGRDPLRPAVRGAAVPGGDGPADTKGGVPPAGGHER